MIDDVAGFHGPLATQAFRGGAHAWIVHPVVTRPVMPRGSEGMRRPRAYATVTAGRRAFQDRGAKVAGSSPLARRCSTSVR